MACAAIDKRPSVRWRTEAAMSLPATWGTDAVRGGRPCCCGTST